jgi:hypothetical protein
VIQVVECLSSKPETMSLNPIAPQKKKILCELASDPFLIFLVSCSFITFLMTYKDPSYIRELSLLLDVTFLFFFLRYWGLNLGLTLSHSTSPFL